MGKVKDYFKIIRNGANIKQNKSQIGYPITRIETISNGIVDRSKMGYAGIMDISEYKDYVLEDGDILMSHINSEQHLGKTALYRKEDNEVIIHGMNLLLLRPNMDKILGGYANYYFKSVNFKKQLSKITKKSVNQASFTVSDLKNLDMQVPDLQTQHKIVQVLDKAQSLIDKRKEQIKQCDELIQSLFYDMFGDPVSNKRGWVKFELNQICDVRDGTHDSPKYQAEGYPLITLKI